MNTETTGQQIRAARLAAGMTTQQMLVDAVNRRRPEGSPQLRQGHLSALENDRCFPSRATLEQIAAATGHRLPDELFVVP